VSMRIYAHEEVFYTRGLSRVGCLAWTLEGDQWVRDAGEVPAGAGEVTIQDVPDSLREELLAFAARAEAMPGSGLGSPN